MPCDHTQDDVLHVQIYVRVWPKFSFKNGNRKRYLKSERTGEIAEDNLKLQGICCYILLTTAKKITLVNVYVYFKRNIIKT